MKFSIIVLAFALSVHAQQEIDEETRNVLAEIFPGTSNASSNSGDFVPVGYDEVTEPSLGSFGASEKCGAGSTASTHLCVSYHLCDGTTNRIVQSGVTDGFGIIDIRFGTNSCGHPLDVCCQLPPGGLNPNFTQSTTEAAPPTATASSPQAVPTTSTASSSVTPVSQPSFCGIRNPNGIDFKIAGNRNDEAEYGEFPWMVAIEDRNIVAEGNQTRLICGGSLITPTIVLTGAHCISRSKASDLIVRAGEWDTQTTRERLPYQERAVREIRAHPNFNGGNLHNDIAILVLDQAVTKAENVGTVCLTQYRQRITSKNCFVGGWGKDVFGKMGKAQAILKKIELPIVQRDTCQTALRGTRLGDKFQLDSSFICAGGESGKDVCTGDGGSPLVCPDPQNPNRYVQVGIVAWGIGCGAQNVPGVYTDVSQFRNWVDQEMIRLNIDTSPYTV